MTSKPRRGQLWIHVVLIAFLLLTMLPFVFMIDNAGRTDSEIYHTYWGVPASIRNMIAFTWDHVNHRDDRIAVNAGEGAMRSVDYRAGMRLMWEDLTAGSTMAWGQLRPYMINSLVVSLATVIGVLGIGSVTAYVFSRFRFPGRNALFLAVLSFMMIPGILTLVPSFLLIKRLQLLDTYWAMILPYIAGGQVLAIFLFKGFFDGLPQDLFDAARIDGAGHLSVYLNIVLPLSKQILAVVAVMNILGTWNSWLWPFLVNPNGTHHVVSSGLYLMSQSRIADNQSAMFAAYVFSFLPLLVLFVYATKPFMAGVTSGAFKA